MKLLRKLWDGLPAYVLWLMASAILWGGIAAAASDTSREKKLVLFADVPAIEDTALAAELERELPKTVRMVKVHPFSYAMFSDGELLNADLYIVPESKLEQYMDSFTVSDEFAEAVPAYLPLPGESDGGCLGVKVYDSATGEGVLKTFVTYGDEDCYLLFGINSSHLGRAGDADNAALPLAEKLLALP